MTDKEMKKEIKAIKEFTKDLIADPEKLNDFLVSTGIYTKNGNLTKHYK